jgi:predicted GTPase
VKWKAGDIARVIDQNQYRIVLCTCPRMIECQNFVVCSFVSGQETVDQISEVEVEDGALLTFVTSTLVLYAGRLWMFGGANTDHRLVKVER